MIKSIPLNKLVQSPRNVRRQSEPAADAELKASIAACGLLQNLIVRPAAKGKFEVDAGERRRRAMLALADDKILARDHEVTCLVLEDSAEAAVETSLAENFHRLAMNPADEAQAFAALVAGGASVEDVARRFGLTVRFVEGRLRLATLAPVVFKALASGEITLDIAKAFGATSDQDIQARVFEQFTSAYYAPNPDSIRRMVLSGTVRGGDPECSIRRKPMTNLVILVGRIARDPETRTTQGGTSITSISVVTDRPARKDGKTYKDENGYTAKDSEFHRITCFNGLGQNVAKYCTKGQLVTIEGRIHYTQWEDQSGTKRYGCEIIADKVDFLTKGRSGSNEGAPDIDED